MSPSSVWVAGIFCLWVTMFTTESAHNIRELAHRVTGKIRRCLTFQVNAEFPCDGYGKVVDFMGERVDKFCTGCSWPNAHDGTENNGVRIGESRVRRTFLHQFYRLVNDTPRCFCVTETRYNTLDVVFGLREQEVDSPPPKRYDTMNHLTSFRQRKSARPLPGNQLRNGRTPWFSCRPDRPENPLRTSQGEHHR